MKCPIKRTSQGDAEKLLKYLSIRYEYNDVAQLIEQKWAQNMKKICYQFTSVS